jgi:hypothetical protein
VPRKLTPERSADGRTLKGDAPSSRNRTPERTGADSSTLKLVHTKPIRAEVIQDYEAEGEEEISIAVGQVVQVTNTTDVDWWEGQIEGVSDVDNYGYFPRAFVELIDDRPPAAGKSARKSKGLQFDAKKSLQYNPPPPKLEPWEDPDSAEYDAQRVQANAAFRQQHADGAKAAKTKKQKQQAAISKKQAEAQALKAAEAEFSAEQNAQLEKLLAEEKRLFAEYQRAFDEGSGMSKPQVQAVSQAYAVAQAEAKAYRQTAIGVVRQRSSAGVSDPEQATVDRTTATRNRTNAAPTASALQPTRTGGAKAKTIDVKTYLAERGLSEWFRPLSLQGQIIRVGQLESITDKCAPALLTVGLFKPRCMCTICSFPQVPPAGNYCKLPRRQKSR